MEKEKKIFGTFDPYFFPKNWQEKSVKTYGLEMANFALIRALLAYGGFDEYHFYKNAKTEVKAFEDFRGGLGLPDAITAKMKLKFLAELAGPAAATKYTVCHHYDPQARPFYYARETFFRQNPFPVSAMVHTISTSVIYDVFTENVLAPTRPYDVFICPSEALKTAVSKYYGVIREVLKESGQADLSYKGKFAVIPLGVDTAKFQPRDKKKLRARLKLPQDRTIVLFIGRLTPANKMDIHPLIHAFKIALERSKEKNALLLIVGKEQLAKYVAGLRKTAKELGIGAKVKIVSDFANRDVPLYYSAADIFVSPSDNTQETFGLTPIEAMASGLPAVISDWDGYKEAVDHGRNGFKVPTYWADCNQDQEAFGPLRSSLESLLFSSQSVAIDVNEYANYLALLLDDAPRREQMGRAARADVLKRYDWQVVIPQLEALWTGLKEEAARDILPQTKRVYGRIPHFELFNHYATRLLRESDRLKISEYGASKLQGKFFDLQLLKAMADKIDIKLVVTLLLNAKEWTGVGELINRRAEDGREKVLYHLMYLLKNNYLVLKS